jgi:hypothetical protein
MAKKKAEVSKEAETKQEPKKYKSGKPFIKSVAKGGVKVEFIASPTGLFGLAYSAGETASFIKDQAEILIDAGVAKKA